VAWPLEEVKRSCQVNQPFVPCKILDLGGFFFFFFFHPFLNFVVLKIGKFFFFQILANLEKFTLKRKKKIPNFFCEKKHVRKTKLLPN